MTVGDSAHSIERLVEANARLAAQLRREPPVVCTRPWTSIEERTVEGLLQPCCWLSRPYVARTDDGDQVLAAWRGDAPRALRMAMRGGGRPDECPPSCPVLGAREQWWTKQELYDYSDSELATFDVRFLANRARVLGAIALADADLGDAFPLRLKVHPANVCNLRCNMCFLDFDNAPPARSWYAGPVFAEMKIYLEEIKVLSGEPFYCKSSRAILLDPAPNPHTHYAFISNGTLIREQEIDMLRARRMGWVDISLDSHLRDTYERIRIRGDFERAMQGLRLVAELGRTHPIRPFDVYSNFCIQELNYREIPEFVRFAASHGVHSNFGVVIDNRAARARLPGDFGVFPADRTALARVLDEAMRLADELGQVHALRSLGRCAAQVAG